MPFMPGRSRVHGICCAWASFVLVVLPLIGVRSLTAGSIAVSKQPATVATPRQPARVAVVGGGIGGAFTAAFLHDVLNTSVEVHVFEKEALGGRTQVAVVGGQAIEVGGSIFCELNYYMRDWTDKLGLTRIPSGGSGSKTPDTPFALFNGHQFVFNQSSWTAVTLYRLIRRYGLSYFWFKSGPKAMVQRFLQYYPAQTGEYAAQTPEELLSHVGLYNLTQITFQQAMQARLGTGPTAQLFVDELLSGINQVNYNQAALNGLAGTVSMFPFVDDRLYHIEGGNYRLAVELFKYAAAKLHQPAQIGTVERQSSGQWRLTFASNTCGTCSVKQDDDLYDAVVIAAPLELAGLQLRGFNVPDIPQRRFKRTVTTIVAGRLRPAYFGVRKLPGETIMVTAGSKTPFSSIAPIFMFPNGTKLYKLFTHEKMSEDLLTAMFIEFSVQAKHDWHAYPVFDPPERFAPFELEKGLIYGNAWENAASAMEMSAVAARNSALLVLQHLSARLQAVDNV